MEARYADLRLDGREDEIPDPEYPQQEWDTCARVRHCFGSSHQLPGTMQYFAAVPRCVCVCFGRYPLPVWKQDMAWSLNACTDVIAAINILILGTVVVRLFLHIGIVHILLSPRCLSLPPLSVSLARSLCLTLFLSVFFRLCHCMSLRRTGTRRSTTRARLYSIS